MPNNYLNINKSAFNAPLNRVSIYNSATTKWQFVPNPNNTILLFSEGGNAYFTPGVKFGLHQPNAVYPDKPHQIGEKDDLLVQNLRTGVFSVMTQKDFDRRMRRQGSRQKAPISSKAIAETNILSEQARKSKAPLSNTIATPPQVQTNRQPLISKSDPTGRR